MNLPATINKLQRVLSAKKLDGPERLVVYALLQYAGQDSACHPSLTTLSANSGHSISTVQRALVRLQKRGLEILSGARDCKTSTYLIIEFLLMLGFDTRTVTSRAKSVENPQRAKQYVSLDDRLSKDTEK